MRIYFLLLCWSGNKFHSLLNITNERKSIAPVLIAFIIDLNLRNWGFSPNWMKAPVKQDCYPWLANMSNYSRGSGGVTDVNATTFTLVIRHQQYSDLSTKT